MIFRLSVFSIPPSPPVFSIPPSPRRRPGPTIAILGLFGLAVFAGQAAAQAPRLSEEALTQIRVLQQEKASRTPAQRKIASRLLLAAKRSRGDALFNALPDLRTTVEVDRRGMTLVDVRAEVSAGFLRRIEELGGEVVNSFPHFRAVRARLPLAAVETLAASPVVVSIRPADTFLLDKINTSEGDFVHAADVTRATFGVDGSGVKVGVISDSVEALADLQLSGDLPPTVTVLPGQASSGTSEGTAMLEIVHDLAPGAELFFATADGGKFQFEQNILDLRAAGCDVIVDDIRYFSEAVFQDDVVADAVDAVVADGALYFSSAGNSGNLNDGTAGVWEGDWSSATPPAGLPGRDVLDFGGGASLNTVTRDSPSFFTLHWSDPQGGSGNDYDLYLLNGAGTTIVSASIDTQNGDDDPFETIDSKSPDHTGHTLAVVRYSGAARFLHLNTNRGELLFATAGQTSGHNSAAGAFGVAAVDWVTAGFGTFTGGVDNPVEGFSSDGPRRVFFRADGSAITPGNFSSTGGELRQKPDIAAADGVSTATPGFDPFFGTSAAAPHAAAIAALMREAHPGLETSGARTIFALTALDIEAPGVDRDSGFGIVMADSTVEEALALPIFTDGFESGNVTAWSSSVP